HLKAEAFLKLMEQLDEIEQTLQTTSQFQRLFILLGAENIDKLQPYLRLWNEAELLIEQDIEIQKAYNLAMQSWHETIVQAIECGQKEGEFKNRSNSTDIAWRLIAFVCGLEGIYKLGLQGLAEQDFKRHTEAIIRLELL
ncbi:TetR family transcriptional regulator, partial [Acinetobacter pittii]|uniref:TetR family transcriptional regulator n=2 Tax=Moraxellaceae TaxID=468 RepID=UPI00300BDF66